MHIRRIVITALAAVIALNAIAGGILLLMAPSGRLLGLSTTLLSGTPFSDYFIPGALLLVAVGGTSSAAALAQLRRAPHKAAFTIAAGITLVGWMAVQYLLLGRVNALQPLVLAMGVGLELLGAVDRILQPASS